MRSLPNSTQRPAPIATGERITNLDAIRGVAVLGILLMNAVSFGLPEAAYFNLSAGGSDTWLDWLIGIAGEVFVDQKTMGLFSMLFGAGIVLFAERASTKSPHPTWLALWRNGLLLLVGLVHGLFWAGDVLQVYAICAPLLIFMSRFKSRTLLVLGTALVLWSAFIAVLVQSTVPASGSGLGEYWLLDGSEISDSVGLFLLNDFFSRSLGMMLIGVALYRLKVFHGQLGPDVYRRMVRLGLGFGLPIAMAGVALQLVADWKPSIAVIGEAPNTLATIPVSLGYVGAITLWNQRRAGAMHHRIHAAGRMALTNYLSATAIGLLVLRGVFDGDSSRTLILGFVFVVWTFQLAWSKPWLDRYRYGPAEWLWRSATYRKLQPLRRS
ncbi:MAG: hypothetical protein ACI9C1_000688 [Candidatus Aldehydirespiratoraceae bacterium]|jgi:uncharacterized protein